MSHELSDQLDRAGVFHQRPEWRLALRELESEVDRLRGEMAVLKMAPGHVYNQAELDWVNERRERAEEAGYAAGLQRAAELCRAADLSGEGMEMAREAIRAELKGEG